MGKRTFRTVLRHSGGSSGGAFIRFQEPLALAVGIAAAIHDGQVDKAGEPYILHALRVSHGVEHKGVKYAIVGVLHDVLEDSGLTEDDLRQEGFSDEVVAAVVALTRREGETYSDYIARVAQNDIAAQVKFVDLVENMNMGRLKEVTKEDVSRCKRYGKALRQLTSLKSSLIGGGVCEPPITVGLLMPEEILDRTLYSVDASIYFTADSPDVINQIAIGDFNPENPNICFKSAKLQPLAGGSYYLDVCWALNATSPAEAEQYVQRNLGNVIPVPPGLRLDRVEVGEDGQAVYDNRKKGWV